MSRNPLLIGAGLLGLTLLTACPVSVGSTHTVEVAAGAILAVDAQPGSFEYWLIDENDDLVEHEVLTVTPGLGALVTVEATDARGIYITTPSTATAPDYSVKFEGSVEDNAPVSYLQTDEPAFEDLRLDDEAAMLTKHAAMEAMNDQVLANWALDHTAQSDALVTLAHDQVTGSQSDLQQGLLVMQDSDDIAAAEAGIGGDPQWVDDAEAAMDLLQPQAELDAGIAEAELLDLEANAPDPAVLTAAIEACADDLELEALEVEALVTTYYPGSDSEKEDPRQDEIDAKYEQILEPALAEIEISMGDIEDCVMEAIGAEPDPAYTEPSDVPYEEIAADAEAAAEVGAAGAEAFQSDLESTWADHEEGEGAMAWDSPGWHAPADAAVALIEAEIGAELFASPTGGVGGTTPPSATSATSRTASAKDDSSADACENTSFVFNFQLQGVGVVIGTPFSDVMRGADVDDGYEVMVGLWGDDCMNGRGGHELMLGNWGDDEMHGGDEHELILGGHGDDTIFAGEGASYSFQIPTTPPIDVELDLGSVIFGGRGNDTISGSDPDYDENDAGDTGYTDLIFGDGLTDDTAGNDTIDGGAGIDFLFGQWGDDTLRNRLPGAIEINGVDWPIGSFHFGGKGDDNMIGSDRFDLMVGGRGDETAIEGRGGLDIILAGKGDDVGVDGGDGLDFVFGGRGDDEVTGGDGIDLVAGNKGDDTVLGGAGVFDLVLGGSGDDVVMGEDGIDFVFGRSGQDWVYGGDGLFDLVFGGTDRDSVFGDDGMDLVVGGEGRDWIEAGSGLVDLAVGRSETDVIYGNDGLDVLLGNGGSDWMSGDAGIDLIFASDGDDVLFGGTGVDVLAGADGADCLWGNDGLDLGIGGDGQDQLVGGAGLDLLLGGAEGDVLFGESGIDIMLGGEGADSLDGGSQLDIILGGAGEDLAYGGTELDIVLGGDEADCVDGEDGEDILLGGDGNDVLLDSMLSLGGAGEDELEIRLIALGGTGHDTILQQGTGRNFVLAGDGNDTVYQTPDEYLSLILGGKGEDTLSIPGFEAEGSGSNTKGIVLSGDGGDEVQASKGKCYVFGQDGDDYLSGEVDGTTSNDDQRDWILGGGDHDKVFGDKKDKRDTLVGEDKYRDEWPSGSWGSLHSPPVLGSCDVMPDTITCDAQMEPPGDVGAKG